MSNFRVNKSDKFTQLENILLRDEKLSMEGLAVLTRLLSRSDNWTSNITELVKNGKDGGWTEGAVKRGFKNLSKLGYAKLVKIYNIESKSMSGSYYEIFENKAEGLAFPNIIYVGNDGERVEKQTTAKQTPLLPDTSGTLAYNNIDLKNKEYKNNYIHAEENKDNISLLTSDTIMYESKKTNIESNCTIPISDVTIQVEKPKKKSKSNFQSNPDKYTWINARVKEFNEGLPKERQFTRPNKSGKTREEKAGNAHLLGVVYEKFGEEKATEFFNYIVAKGEWRNPYSISSLKNQEEFENFYQDPQEEQPKYLTDKKFSSFGRYKFDQEEPSLGSFYNEDSFYAALEYYYSQNYSGTELVKKVRERVKEINCKYNKY